MANVYAQASAGRCHADLLGPLVWVSSSGSLAISVATPRASSRVSSLAAARRPGSSSKYT